MVVSCVGSAMKPYNTIFSRDSLTYIKAIEIARGMESADKDSKSF